MMRGRIPWEIALWALFLNLFPDANSQTPICGFYEEGSNAALTCSTRTQVFTKYGPRFKINGTFQEMSYCDSDGNCHNEDVDQYKAVYLHNILTSRRNVSIHINGVTREMIAGRCYIDGTPLFNAECEMRVFVSPSKPNCVGPEFNEEGTAAILTCTSERVYPTAECEMLTSVGNEEIDVSNLITVSRTLSQSEQYPDDFQLKCVFRLELNKISESPYKLIVRFYPEIPDPPPTTITTADAIPILDLRALTLTNPGDSNGRIDFDAATGQLRVNISVVSNPAPTSYSLSVRQDVTSATSTSVSSQHYSVVYYGSSTTGSSNRGIIELTLKDNSVMSGQRTALFRFSAANRVLGTSDFEYLFTAVMSVPPTQPTCDTPTFTDGGATALLTCVSDRVYPMGICSFELQPENSGLSGQLSVSTRNDDSSVYPGDKISTCQLRVPVTGSRAGEYQFQVEVTTTGTAGTESASALTPVLSLKATELYDAQENNHVFDYPSSGDLAVDVHVTGSPEPNRVTLWVRNSQMSSRVPVSSRDFSWSYVSGVGGLGARGFIQLILRGLQPVAQSLYTLEVENGVAGGDNFEYMFTVQHLNMQPTRPTCESPAFIEEGAKSFITCTSDRVSPLGTCNFKLLTKNATLQENPLIVPRNVESTAYPGYKTVTCELTVPVTGNRDGAYQFEVEVTNTAGSVRTSATAPLLHLKATRLYDAADNNHVFDYPDSGELAVDVHVTGNPEPNRVTLWVRDSDSSAGVPVSRRDFSWAYETSGGRDSGVIQVTLSRGLNLGVVSRYTLRADNGVVGESELEYMFAVDGVDFAAPNTATGKDDDGDDNMPVIIGAVVGGVVFLAIIVIVVVVVLLKRRKPREEPPAYNIGDFDPPPHYIYPIMDPSKQFQGGLDNGGYCNPSEHAYERPVSTGSEAEYAEPFENP